MTEIVYSREQIEQWERNLKKLARQPRTSFSKKQVVKALIDSIEKALRTRSYQEVADALKQDGLDIASSSLKQYVSAYRRERSLAQTKRKRPPTKAEEMPQEDRTSISQSQPKATGKSLGKDVHLSQSPEAEKTATKKTVRGRTKSAEKADPKIKNSLLR